MKISARSMDGFVRNGQKSVRAEEDKGHLFICLAIIGWMVVLGCMAPKSTDEFGAIAVPRTGRCLDPRVIARSDR